MAARLPPEGFFRANRARVDRHAVKYPVDANVLSEPTKKVPDSKVVDWLRENEREIVVDPIVRCASAFSSGAAGGGAPVSSAGSTPASGAPLFAMGGRDGFEVGAAARKSSHRWASYAHQRQPYRRHRPRPRLDCRHAQPRRFREGRRQHHRPLRVILRFEGTLSSLEGRINTLGLRTRFRKRRLP